MILLSTLAKPKRSRSHQRAPKQMQAAVEGIMCDGEDDDALTPLEREARGK